MNWEAISAIGEIVSAIAVVASLAYLAVQIRQNTTALKAATVQDMTGKWIQINLWVAESDRDFSLTNVEPESDEFRKRLAFWRALFHQWANNLYQYKAGVMEEVAFRPTEKEIRLILEMQSAKSVRLAWDAVRQIYNEEFRDFFESILLENRQGNRS